MKDKMLYIGIDPALNSTGVCVLNSDYEILDLITIKPKLQYSFIEKLNYIQKQFKQLLDKYKEREYHIIIEDTIIVKNYQSGIKLSKTWGLIVGCLLDNVDSAKISIVSPSLLKQKIYGNGSASKSDVKIALSVYGIDISKISNFDESDAVGFALFGILSNKFNFTN